MKLFLSVLGAAAFLSALLALAPLSHMALQVQSVPDWEDPSVVAINKEPSHATLFPFENRELALANDRDESSFFQLLNGDWRFHWVRSPGERPQDFYREEIACVERVPV